MIFLKYKILNTFYIIFEMKYLNYNYNFYHMKYFSKIHFKKSFKLSIRFVNRNKLQTVNQKGMYYNARY